MLSLSWLKAIALTPASCPADPFLAPWAAVPTLLPYPPDTPPQDIPTVLAVIPPPCHFHKTYTRCTASMAQGQVHPRGSLLLLPLPCPFHPPHSSQLQVLGLPRQLQSSASCLDCVLPSPPSVPLCASLRAALPGAAVDSDFHQDFDN